MLQLYHLIARNTLFGIVEERAVGTDIGENVRAIFVMNQAMLAGEDAFWVF